MPDAEQATGPVFARIAPRSVPCRKCLAPKGARCLSPSKRPTRVAHEIRHRDALLGLSVVKPMRAYFVCRTCGEVGYRDFPTCGHKHRGLLDVVAFDFWVMEVGFRG